MQRSIHHARLSSPNRISERILILYKQPKTLTVSLCKLAPYQIQRLLRFEIPLPLHHHLSWIKPPSLPLSGRPHRRVLSARLVAHEDLSEVGDLHALHRREVDRAHFYLALVVGGNRVAGWG